MGVFERNAARGELPGVDGLDLLHAVYQAVGQDVGRARVLLTALVNLGGSFKVNETFEAYGRIDTLFDREPDVFIPVGTPGIDHAGTVFRIDSIVSLPLGALRVATLPSVAEAVRRIAGAVA